MPGIRRHLLAIAQGNKCPQVANGRSPPTGASPGEHCVRTVVLSEKSPLPARTENQTLLRNTPNLQPLWRHQAVWPHSLLATDWELRGLRPL